MWGEVGCHLGGPTDLLPSLPLRSARRALSLEPSPAAPASLRLSVSPSVPLIIRKGGAQPTLWPARLCGSPQKAPS